MLLRNLGVLEGKNAFCCDCTFAQCHTITEVAVCGKLSLNELAARLKMDKSLMSRTVDELVKKGYLKREQDPDDRRYVIIQLTEQGEHLHAGIEVQARQKFAELLSSIPEEQRIQVIKGLEALNLAVEKLILKT